MSEVGVILHCSLAVTLVGQDLGASFFRISSVNHFLLPFSSTYNNFSICNNGIITLNIQVRLLLPLDPPWMQFTSLLGIKAKHFESTTTNFESFSIFPIILSNSEDYP